VYLAALPLKATDGGDPDESIA